MKQMSPKKEFFINFNFVLKKEINLNGNQMLLCVYFFLSINNKKKQVLHHL